MLALVLQQVVADLDKQLLLVILLENAVAVALELRETGSKVNPLFERLAADKRLGLTRDELHALVSSPLELTGAARVQVGQVVAQVEKIVADDPESAQYRPGAVL